MAREFFHDLAAWSELGIALLFIYGSAANLLNGQHRRTMLPVGKAFGPTRG